MAAATATQTSATAAGEPQLVENTSEVVPQSTKMLVSERTKTAAIFPATTDADVTGAARRRSRVPSRRSWRRLRPAAPAPKNRKMTATEGA